jgi:hypothetical protein
VSASTSADMQPWLVRETSSNRHAEGRVIWSVNRFLLMIA